MYPNFHACLFNAARRLRYLRRFPQPYTYQANNDSIRLGMAYAYEYALRVLIDEFGAVDEFGALFYGADSEQLPEAIHRYSAPLPVTLPGESPESAAAAAGAVATGAQLPTIGA